MKKLSIPLKKFKSKDTKSQALLESGDEEEEDDGFLEAVRNLDFDHSFPDLSKIKKNEQSASPSREKVREEKKRLMQEEKEREEREIKYDAENASIISQDFEKLTENERRKKQLKEKEKENEERERIMDLEIERERELAKDHIFDSRRRSKVSVHSDKEIRTSLDGNSSPKQPPRPFRSLSKIHFGSWSKKEESDEFDDSARHEFQFVFNGRAMLAPFIRNKEGQREVPMHFPSLEVFSFFFFAFYFLFLIVFNNFKLKTEKKKNKNINNPKSLKKIIIPPFFLKKKIFVYDAERAREHGDAFTHTWYKIRLRYGHVPYEWIIKRSYKDILSLHSKLSLMTIANRHVKRLPNPPNMLFQRRNGILIY